MCELCLQHGEGKKWYEVVNNYSLELYARNGREQYAKEFIKQTQTSTKADIEKMIRIKKKHPGIFRQYSRVGTWYMKKHHLGQVIPLEEAEMIIDRVHSVTRIPCVCRSALKGNKNARYCFALSIDPTGLFGDYSELKKGLEVITRTEAKALLKQFDQQGLVHSIWTFKTPFIGAMCNCDRDCFAYKVQVAEELMQVMYKADYVARVDPLSCSGCRNCLKMCQFGAIEFSTVDEKCYINKMKCFGCGVCRNACHKEALYLENKQII